MERKSVYLKRPRNAQAKVRYISWWARWFYDRTESLRGSLSLSLAYLWPAICNDHQISVHPNSSIVHCLKHHDVPETCSIWSYIDIER